MSWVCLTTTHPDGICAPCAGSVWIETGEHFETMRPSSHVAEEAEFLQGFGHTHVASFS